MNLFEQFFGSVTLWARAVRTFLATFFSTLGGLPVVDAIGTGLDIDNFGVLLLTSFATALVSTCITLGIGLAPQAPDPNAAHAVKSPPEPEPASTSTVTSSAQTVTSGSGYPRTRKK